MSEIECPYCGKGQGYPDEHVSEGIPVEMECGDCGKNFVYYTEYSVSYDSYKAPCLNGEEHKWLKITGYPEEVFEKQYRCEYCGQEKKLSDEEIAKLSKEKTQ